MCPIHHDVIDADPEAYTVARLIRMKQNHEASQPEQAELSDQATEQFIANLDSNELHHGSIIYSVNQSGGQIAHSITNIGPQPRRLSPAAASTLARALRALPTLPFEIEVVDGDSEANRLAHQVKDALVAAGWECHAFASSKFPSHVAGVTISTPSTGAGVMALVDALNVSGLWPKLAVQPSLNRIHVLIGSQL